MQALHTHFRLWRLTYSDDSVGGAVVTGTISGEFRGHLQLSPQSQLSLEQGLETPRVGDILLMPMWSDPVIIYERDQLEVVGPAGHPQINERFRVVSVIHPAIHPRDRRRFVKVRVTRVDRSRRELWQ